MKRDYLGDSYDAVKRLWQQLLADWEKTKVSGTFFGFLTLRPRNLFQAETNRCLK